MPMCGVSPVPLSSQDAVLVSVPPDGSNTAEDPTQNTDSPARVHSCSQPQQAEVHSLSKLTGVLTLSKYAS